jgi:hypothetical protein
MPLAVGTRLTANLWALPPLSLYRNMDVNGKPTWPPSDDRPDPDKLHGKQPFVNSNLFWAIVGIILLLIIFGPLI